MVAAAGLLVTFAVFDLLLFNVLRVSLNRSLDASAQEAASGVAALYNARRLPDEVPVTPVVTVQVLNPAGRIINASSSADRYVPLLTRSQAAASAASGSGRLVDGRAFAIPAVLRVDAVRAAGGAMVIAAVPYASVSDSL